MSARQNRHLANHLGDCSNKIVTAMESEEFRDALEPGASCSVTRSNDDYAVVTTVTRRLHQRTIPFEQPKEVQPKTSPSPSANGAEDHAAKLCRIHFKILEKASATDPRTAKELIRAAGYKDNSYARAAVTLLYSLHKLVRVADGYLLAA